MIPTHKQDKVFQKWLYILAKNEKMSLVHIRNIPLYNFHKPLSSSLSSHILMSPYYDPRRWKKERLDRTSVVKEGTKSDI